MTIEPAAVGIDRSPSPTDATQDLPARHEEREAFVAAHYEGVYRWLWWQCRCPEVAADLTQDTFVAFWQSQRHTHVRAPRVWIYRIARNRWRKWMRDERGGRAARGGGALPPELVGETRDLAASAARAESARLITTAIDALEPVHRDVILLRFGGDLPFSEIARILDVPAVLARWRAHQARQRLREWLETDRRQPEGEVPDDPA